MIVWASAALMGYELVATTTHRTPTITILSHRRPYGIVVWGWVIWLVLHLIAEAVTIPKGARL